MSVASPEPPAVQIPARVRQAYGLEGARLRSISMGWINQTFRVERESGPDLALQRLHPIFGPEVHEDIEAVTRHLEAKGLSTPRIERSAEGALCVEAEGGLWRALRWLEGQAFVSLRSRPERLRSAGRLVGRFHAALADLDHDFAFRRAGVHDTEAHLARLLELLDERGAQAGLSAVAQAASAVLEQATSLPPIATQPQRLLHGDLKASNLLFDAAGERALALLDLDTLGRGPVAVELGDALRSWCNRADEDDPASSFDADAFEAALEGYAQGAPGWLLPEEIRSIVPGIERISLELASRFAADAFEDRYFGWDPSRYRSRRRHNLARVRGQLALLASLRAARPDLEARAARAFGLIPAGAP
ncbi:MAG: phosphotransferase [Myxococcales bacterium]|nr:phosphotransferase [Myxococcales bacterium]